MFSRFHANLVAMKRASYRNNIANVLKDEPKKVLEELARKHHISIDIS